MQDVAGGPGGIERARPVHERQNRVLADHARAARSGAQPRERAAADTLLLAAIATAALVAVSLQRSDWRQVTHTSEVLQRAGASIAGTVVTHAPAGSRDAAGANGYGHGYGYGYEYGTTPAEAKQPA